MLFLGKAYRDIRVEWGNAPNYLGKTPTAPYQQMYEGEVPAGKEALMKRPCTCFDMFDTFH